MRASYLRVLLTRSDEFGPAAQDVRKRLGDANLINTELDRYLAVTKEDIRAAAKKYFNKNNRVVLYYMPKPTQP